MVDLVKLRKKAKKDKDQAQAGESGSGIRPAEKNHSPLPATLDSSAPSSTAVSELHPEVPPDPAPSQPIPDASVPGGDPRTPAPAAGAPRSADKLIEFKRSAGKRREGFIEEEAETSAADQVELLTFVLGGEQYAVEIDHIVEIVTPRGATHVPNADRSIVGIISLRGTIVTVVDIRQKLGHPPRLGSNDTRTIVAERNGETLGFEVDRVLRVLKVGTGAIEAHPIVHTSEQSESIRGVFRHANALTILLDLDKLLA